MGNLSSSETINNSSKNVSKTFGNPTAGVLQYGMDEKGNLVFVCISYHLQAAPLIFGGGDVIVDGVKIERELEIIPNDKEFPILSNIPTFSGKVTVLHGDRFRQFNLGSLDADLLLELARRADDNNFSYIEWLESHNGMRQSRGKYNGVEKF